MFRVYTWEGHLGFRCQDGGLLPSGNLAISWLDAQWVTANTDYSCQIQMATHRMHLKGRVQMHTSAVLNSCWSSVKCSSSVCVIVIFFLPVLRNTSLSLISTSNGPFFFQIKHISKHCHFHQSHPRSRCFCLVVLLVRFWLLWWATW